MELLCKCGHLSRRITNSIACAKCGRQWQYLNGAHARDWVCVFTPSIVQELKAIKYGLSSAVNLLNESCHALLSKDDGRHVHQVSVIESFIASLPIAVIGVRGSADCGSAGEVPNVKDHRDGIVADFPGWRRRKNPRRYRLRCIALLGVSF